MTPRLLAKIKRLADDPRTDPMTRKIAQAQLDSHNGVTEAPGLHPGMRQTPEYQAYAKAMKENNRGRR
jgi:hypothetical protein